MKPTIRKPTEEERKEAKSWPIWGKERSVFPWEYNEQETCLIIGGEVIVTNEEDERFGFGSGDYVIFPEGMGLCGAFTSSSFRSMISLKIIACEETNIAANTIKTKVT